MSKNKNPNKIIIKDDIELFGAYSIEGYELNYYTLRLSDRENNTMWDWYHTTGTLLRHDGSRWHKQKSFRDVENCAEFIRKYEDQ